jgi:exopolyphosphatase/guanosine-5'-triphosphate,3'-diphosphate pyrophosphatase
LNFTPAGSAAEPVIEFKRLEGLNKMMAGISTADRARLPIISQQRAEVIVAGGQILEGVMRELRIERLQACTWALREGVIIDHLRELEVESLPPVPDVEDRSLRGVFVIGRRFGYEEGHALQVARLAEKIFDAVSKDHGLQRHHRTLLSAAALLHDIGFHVSHDSHHKHSHYLIQHSELTGFSEAEKAVIGNVARYHRSSFPKDKHPDFAKLGDKDRDLVWKLGAILRLADALDRSYENAVTDLKMRREKTGYSLKLKGGPSLERELQAAERKKDMFETAYNCSVRLS